MVATGVGRRGAVLVTTAMRSVRKVHARPIAGGEKRAKYDVLGKLATQQRQGETKDGLQKTLCGIGERPSEGRGG
jgi:hypothetical protein